MFDAPSLSKSQKRNIKLVKERSKPDSEWTAFRTQEKKYKSRIPSPDVSDALDFRVNESTGGWQGRSNAAEYTSCSLSEHKSAYSAYSLTSIPGLVILPAFLSPKRQKELVRWSLCEHATFPNPTNLDVHYDIPKGTPLFQLNKDRIIQPLAALSTAVSTSDPTTGPRQLVQNTPASTVNYQILSQEPKPEPLPSSTVPPLPVSSLLYKLRWANIGWSYNWQCKQYDFTKGKAPIGTQLRDICKNAVAAVDWAHVFKNTDADWPSTPDWNTWGETYDPDAGIVNFYQTKDTLMAHVDRSEVCATSPLVSISLGHAAIFLIGGSTRDEEPTPILLRSGDIVIMSGPICRRAYHGVPRILENTLPGYFEDLTDKMDDEDEALLAYMRSTRININVRQVFPKGFEP